MAQVNIIIVDDQNLFRQSLAMLINHTSHFNLVAEYAGGQQLLNRLTNAVLKVDIAVIDMDMPDINGIELNKLLHQQYPHIKVIILSVHVNEMLVTQMINSGAASYLAKNCDKDELITAIDTVYKNGFYFNEAALKAIRNSANHKSETFDVFNHTEVILTDREKQILRLICMEYNNTEIATELYLSARTVEGYRIKLLKRINCRNTAGLVLYAIKNGIVKV